MAEGKREEDGVQADPQGVIEPFNLSGVRLGPSRLRDQYEHTRNYYLAIPDDDILKVFRERAGMPAPGQHLGGWYSGDDLGMFYSDGGFGNAFGQWISALARMAKATGDAEAGEKALRLWAGWAETIAPDGFFFPLARSRWIAYDYDKLCAAMLDLAEFLGRREALNDLGTITRWALDHLDRGFLETPPRLSEANAEWYTLSENQYRAYVLTGDSTYRDFAQVWHYTAVWDALAQGEDAFLGHHAYSHVNMLSSAAMAFAMTGERRYFDTIQNAYRILWDHHLYATGGFGPQERFVPPDGSLERQTVNPYNWLGYRASFETPCGSWAAFKVCRYLMGFTGSARYGDWIERLLYNGIGAALPMAGRGETFYYSDYGITGGVKVYHPERWPCCSGTYPLAVTEYHNLIYFKDADGLYVNLFVPSQVDWEMDGAEVRLVQETRFPENDTTSLTVHTTKPMAFSLHVRVPGWVAGDLSARVNGKSVRVNATPGEWAEVQRVWRDGDTLQVTLPMRLTFAPIDAHHPQRAALMMGPVVLVADRGTKYPPSMKLVGDQADPASWIVAGEEPLTFRPQGDALARTFRPFYQFGEGTPYWMYLDVVEK